MQVVIRTSGDTDGRGLMPWLAKDPVARNATFSAEPGAPDEMGLAETIQAVLGSATDLGSLVMAVAAYVESRRTARAVAPTAESSQPVVVRLEHGGVTAVVRSDDPEEIAQVIETLRRARQDGNEDG